MGSVHILPFLTYSTGNNPNRPSSNRNRSTNGAFSLGTIAGEQNNFRACSHDMSHTVLIPSKFCVPRNPPPPSP